MAASSRHRRSTVSRSGSSASQMGSLSKASARSRARRCRSSAMRISARRRSSIVARARRRGGAAPPSLRIPPPLCRCSATTSPLFSIPARSSLLCRSPRPWPVSSRSRLQFSGRGPCRTAPLGPGNGAPPALGRGDSALLPCARSSLRTIAPRRPSHTIPPRLSLLRSLTSGGAGCLSVWRLSAEHGAQLSSPSPVPARGPTHGSGPSGHAPVGWENSAAGRFSFGAQPRSAPAALRMSSTCRALSMSSSLASGSSSVHSVAPGGRGASSAATRGVSALESLGGGGSRSRPLTIATSAATTSFRLLPARLRATHLRRLLDDAGLPETARSVAPLSPVTGRACHISSCARASRAVASAPPPCLGRRSKSRRGARRRLALLSFCTRRTCDVISAGALRLRSDLVLTSSPVLGGGGAA